MHAPRHGVSETKQPCSSPAKSGSPSTTKHHKHGVASSRQLRPSWHGSKLLILNTRESRKAGRRCSTILRHSCIPTSDISICIGRRCNGFISLLRRASARDLLAERYSSHRYDFIIVTSGMCRATLTGQRFYCYCAAALLVRHRLAHSWKI